MNVTLAGVSYWLRQTSTIAGISVIVGLVAAVVGKQLTVQEAVAPFCGALAAMMIPENNKTPSITSVTGTGAQVQAESVSVSAPAGSITTIK